MRYSQSGILKDTRPWGKMFVAGAAAVTLAVGMMASVFAATTSVVTPSNMQGWVDQSASGGAVTLVNDAPAGYETHSLELTTDNTNPARAVYYKDAGNVDLDTVTELSYWTKQVSATSAGGSASYFVGLDLNGDGMWDTNVIHEPYWQDSSPDPAPVANGVWQSWDVDAGKFWSTRTYDGPTLDLAAGAGGPPLYTLAELKAGFPDAKVLSFGTNVGTYNPDYVVRVDAINFNGTTYDYELVEPDTVAPTVPQNLGWKSGSTMLACDSVTSSYSISAKWDASSDSSGVVSYDYRVMTPLRTTWDAAYQTSVNSNQYNGSFTEGEGVYTYQVRAVDAEGNKSEWSDSCAIRYSTDTTPKVLGTQECKNGLYKNVYTAENKSFKNQGACVSYVVASDNASFKRDNQ